jgi:hypothetical protein
MGEGLQTSFFYREHVDVQVRVFPASTAPLGMSMPAQHPMGGPSLLLHPCGCLGWSLPVLHPWGGLCLPCIPGEVPACPAPLGMPLAALQPWGCSLPALHPWGSPYQHCTPREVPAYPVPLRKSLPTLYP